MEAGYLIFSHGAEIPDALIQSVFADYEFWAHEADFDGHEGVFYRCGMTDMLNRDVGNVQQKISIVEVCHTSSLKHPNYSRSAQICV